MILTRFLYKLCSFVTSSWILFPFSLLTDQFRFGFGQPEWRLNQASHVVRNYSNAELDPYCRLTDINRINTYLDNILIPRTVDSENHIKVSVYIRTTLEALGYRTEFFSFTNDTVVGPRRFTNIVATRHPLARRRLVLACHYDSKEFTSIKFFGATDSAVPCALLLDVAHTLQDFMPARPLDDLTLQLIFFDGEEAFKFWDMSDSLYGSKYQADLWASQMYPPFSFHKTREIDRIDALVLLDLLGTSNPTIQNYPAANDAKLFYMLPDIEDQLAKIPGCLAVINRIFEPYDSYVNLQDDHLPFLHYKVKIVHVIPWPFPTVWHKETDNREALDTPTIENLSAIMRVFVVKYLGL